MSEAFNEENIDRDLQVRVLALVQGEASDFEHDQLQLVMEQRPEVAAYYQHLLRMHELLSQSAIGVTALADDVDTSKATWKLSAGRRESLLAMLNCSELTAKEATIQFEPIESPAQYWKSRWQGANWLPIALVTTTAAIVLIGLLLPRIQLSKVAARPDGVAGYATLPYWYDNPSSQVPKSSSVPAVNVESTFLGAEAAPSSPYPQNGAPTFSTDRLMHESPNTLAKRELSQSELAKAEGYFGQAGQATQSTPADTKGLLGGIQRESTDEREGRASGHAFRQDLSRSKPESYDSRQGQLSFPKLAEDASGQGMQPTTPTGASMFSDVDINHVQDIDLDITKGVKENVQRTLDMIKEKPASGQAQFELKPSAVAPEIVVAQPDNAGTKHSVTPRLLIEDSENQAARGFDEQSTNEEAVSTFSLHVSDVSFKLAEAALKQGQWPSADTIRVEEFVNAIDYYDPLPSSNEKIACNVEQAIHPLAMQRNLLRISMRTAAAGRSQSTPLRLTLLLDNSGSMERPDRRQTVLKAIGALTAQLTAADQVTLISFANQARLLADKVPGNQAETLLRLVESLPSEGGTNIEAALALGREKALEQKLASAQNRIVLFTDGAVNLGNADPESLSRLVTQARDSGVAFDAAGISAYDLNDAVLEALTRKGDGRYYLLNSAESVEEGFAAQIAGALRPSAQNVKVQVEFNPQRVGRYKLFGFDKHRLNKEDFRNDQVDAAEMSAAEAGVAVYQFEAKPNGSGDVGSVSVRFRDVATGQMMERRWPILYDPSTSRLEDASSSMRLAATAAFLGVKLAGPNSPGGALADSIEFSQLQRLLTNLAEPYDQQPRARQMRAMIQQAGAINQ